MTNHIFLLDTELQCYAALKIIELEGISNPVLFSFTPNIQSYLTKIGVNSAYLKKKYKGPFSRSRSLHKSVSKIKPYLGDRNIFYIHRLDLIYVNVVIGTLCQKHDIEVRIVPEGMLNYSLEDASQRWLHQSKRWPLRINYGLTGLQKLEIEGERIGADSSIVKSIYCFHGLESPYPREKVIYLPPLSSSNNKNNFAPKKALVVGHPILKSSLDPNKLEEKISNKIMSILTEHKIVDLDYAPHPRDKSQNFKLDHYTSIQNSYLCLEQHLETHHYDLVISCLSTVLLTAKLIFGDNIQSISVGANIFPSTAASIESIRKTFLKANVEMIDL